MDFSYTNDAMLSPYIGLSVANARGKRREVCYFCMVLLVRSLYQALLRPECQKSQKPDINVLSIKPVALHFEVQLAGF
jgi:hypothetical protein